MTSLFPDAWPMIQSIIAETIKLEPTFVDMNVLFPQPRSISPVFTTEQTDLEDLLDANNLIEGYRKTYRKLFAIAMGVGISTENPVPDAPMMSVIRKIIARLRSKCPVGTSIAGEFGSHPCVRYCTYCCILEAAKQLDRRPWISGDSNGQCKPGGSAGI